MPTIKKEHFVGELAANISTPDTMYPLAPGENRIDVVYPDGTAGTVTPKQTKDPNNVTNLGPVELCGDQIVLTNTYSYIAQGPGWMCFIVSGFSGSNPISVFGSR